MTGDRLGQSGSRKEEAENKVMGCRERRFGGDALSVILLSIRGWSIGSWQDLQNSIWQNSHRGRARMTHHALPLQGVYPAERQCRQAMRFAKLIR